jgi:hypothetical protein
MPPLPIAPPAECVVLVPAGGPIDRECDATLRELEKRGHPVWRVPGTRQLTPPATRWPPTPAQGFAELMWIDSDIAFDPDDFEKLRGHGLQIACGLYPKKGPREFACEFLPGTPGVRFGQHGGQVEVRYCGLGFTLVRKDVFQAIHHTLKLPICNRRFGTPLVPFFQPLIVGEPAGPWSLSEDYAFCERAPRCGYKVVADTTIRLWHVGSYKYGWEDAGGGAARFLDYMIGLGPLPALPPSAPSRPRGTPRTGSVITSRSGSRCWPLVGKPVHTLEIGAFQA